MSAIVEKLASLAKEVVGDFMQKGASLDEGIAKVAERDNLNTDEIKRLVEASNTLTWLKTVKPQMDKTAEFSVASYDGVMSKIHGPVKEAMYDVNGFSYDVVDSAIEKTASAPEVHDFDSLSHMTEMEKVAALKARKSIMSKAAAAYGNIATRREFDLKCDLAEVKDDIVDGIKKLAFSLSSVGARPFAEFEKRAYAQFDYKAIKAILDLVHNECTFDKQASIRAEVTSPGRLFMLDTDKDIQTLKQIADNFVKMATIRQALTEKTDEFSRKQAQYASILGR